MHIPPSIWKLAWPTIVSNLLLVGIGLIQIIIATGMGAEAVAATTISQRFFFILQSALFGLAIGVSAIVSRNIGAKELEKAGQATQTALFVGFSLSAIIAALCFLFAPNITDWFGLKADTQKTTISLVRWVCLFSPIYSINIIFTTSLRATGDALNPLYLSMISFSGNAFGSIALSSGLWWLPNLGVEGITIGAIFGSLLTIVIFSYMWRQGKYKLAYPIKTQYRKKLKILLKTSIPSAVEQTMMQVGFLIFTLAVANYGTKALAAYGVGLNILSIIIVIALALSTAGAIIVGQYVGAKQIELASAQGWRTWRVSFALLLVSAIFMATNADWLSLLLNPDKDVQEYTSLFLTIVAIAMPFIATDFALGGAIRGAGETVYPLVVTLAVLIIVRFILPYLFLQYSLSLTLLFSLTAMDFLLKAIFMTWYFHSKRWAIRGSK